MVKKTKRYSAKTKGISNEIPFTLVQRNANRIFANLPNNRV